MRIAIASGKGGTGKTTVALNLAAVSDAPVTYVDCDVEAPNGHLFLHPMLIGSREIGIPVPAVDEVKCTHCGQCVPVCRFNAMAFLRNRVVIFPDLCHGCSGCILACPAQAIAETERPIGMVEWGCAGKISLIQGRLHIGVALVPPLIRAVKGMIPANTLTFIDAPPGTSCAMMAAVRDCDYCVLVTEPTPFGLHDLSLAIDSLRQTSLSFGVVINRAGMGDDRVAVFCEREQVDLLGELPDDRRVAEAYACGQLAINAVPDWHGRFRALWEAIQHKVDPRGVKGIKTGGSDA